MDDDCGDVFVLIVSFPIHTHTHTQVVAPIAQPMSTPLHSLAIHARPYCSEASIAVVLTTDSFGEMLMTGNYSMQVPVVAVLNVLGGEIASKANENENDGIANEDDPANYNENELSNESADVGDDAEASSIAAVTDDDENLAILVAFFASHGNDVVITRPALDGVHSMSIYMNAIVHVLETMKVNTRISCVATIS